METTNEKKCPKCESYNVVDTGNRIGEVTIIDPTIGKIPKANYPIYECKEEKDGKQCGERFLIRED